MDWIIRQSPFTHAAWGLLIACAAQQFALGHAGWGWVALSGAGACLMWVLFERYLGLAAPRSFIAGFSIFVVATLMLGEIRLFYAGWWWWDWGLHTVAGLGFGTFGALVARGLGVGLGLRRPRAVGAVGTVAFLFGTACGALWEMFEYVVDIAFAIDTQTSLPDTMHDIICNTLGSLGGAAMGAAWAAGRSVGPVGDCLDDFVDANPHLLARRRTRTRRLAPKKEAS